MTEADEKRMDKIRGSAIEAALDVAWLIGMVEQLERERAAAYRAGYDQGMDDGRAEQ